MTEAEWQCADLATRYEYVLPRCTGEELNVLPRKGRLLWVAWAREVYSQLPWLNRLEVDYAELLADNPALTDTDLRFAIAGGLEGISYLESASERVVAIRELELRLQVEFGLLPDGNKPPDAMAEGRPLNQADWALSYHTPSHRRVPDSKLFASYFGDIFDNPFRSSTFYPSWRSETAVALATGIYEERAFDRMPILADALEEAGCDNPDILAHCRGPGPHVRGCWVVDLVLGKE